MFMGTALSQFAKNEEEHKEDWDGNMQNSTTNAPLKPSAPPTTEQSIS